MRPLARLLIGLVIGQLSVGPVYAQWRNSYQVQDRRLPQEKEPSSFRRFEQQKQEISEESDAGQSSVFERGKTLSEGSLTGVTYQVHIVGEVERPGTYRLAASDRLQEALQLAGGVLENGSMRHVSIRRKDAKTASYDLLQFRLNGDLRNNPYLLDNDVVHVPLRRRTVQIVGAVRRPGEYELNGERTVAQALALAGGGTVGIEHQAPIRVIRYVRGDKQVLEVSQEPSALRGTTIENGDVVFIPNILSAKNDFDYNIARIPGDQIFYPSYEDRVFVLGGVRSPGPYEFNTYYGVDHYLTVAGGVTQLARRNRAELIRPDGKKIKVAKAKKDGLKINPGDTIYVPERRLPPESLIQLIVSMIAVGVSTAATVIYVTR